MLPAILISPAISALAQTLVRVGAPVLAEMLTKTLPPPFGPLAGIVIPALAQAFGVAPTPEAVATEVERRAEVDSTDTANVLRRVEDEQRGVIEDAQAQLDEYRKEFEGTQGWSQVFFAGWRPALAWSLVAWVNIILLHVWLGGVVTEQFLAIWNPAWMTLAGLLGLRTFEKFTGVAGGIAGEVVGRVAAAKTIARIVSPKSGP